MGSNKDMIGAAHDVMLAKGDFVLSANLLERIYMAMSQAAPKRPNARLSGRGKQDGTE